MRDCGPDSFLSDGEWHTILVLNILQLIFELIISWRHLKTSGGLLQQKLEKQKIPSTGLSTFITWVKNRWSQDVNFSTTKKRYTTPRDSLHNENFKKFITIKPVNPFAKKIHSSTCPKHNLPYKRKLEKPLMTILKETIIWNHKTHSVNLPTFYKSAWQIWTII